MKKLLLLFILISSFGKTQVVFCPPGAQWNYLFTQAWHIPWATVNESIKYFGSTIENGDVVLTINHTKFFSERNSGFIYYTSLKQKGDTIYMRNTFTNNQWQVLYNFAASVGQSWNNAFTNGDTYTTTVVATGTALVANLSVKQLTVNYTGKSGSYNLNYDGIISERFGSNSFLFNYTSRKYSDGDMVLEFLCYKDDGVGVKQFSSKSCDFSNKVGLSEGQIDSELVKIYPNPVTDYLSIESSSIAKELDVYLRDVIGNKAMETKLTGRTVIDLHRLKQGIYILEVREKGKLIKTEKLIKE